MYVQERLKVVAEQKGLPSGIVMSFNGLVESKQPDYWLRSS